MNKDQLIENYFSNCLSEEERKLFDGLIESDSDFKNKVDFEMRVKNAIHKKEHQKLKQHFKKLDDSIKNKDKTPNKRVWLIAASIAILVLLSLSYNFLNKNYSSEELYVSYYKPAKNIVQPIVRNENSKTAKVEAFIAYQKEDYAEAEKLFSKLYTSTEDSELLFYEGISLLELNKTDAAISKFNTHLMYKDAVSDMTEWYLAMAYLKNDDIKNAKMIFTKMVEDASITFKKEEAKIVLKKL